MWFEKKWDCRLFWEAVSKLHLPEWMESENRSSHPTSGLSQNHIWHSFSCWTLPEGQKTEYMRLRFLFQYCKEYLINAFLTPLIKAKVQSVLKTVKANRSEKSLLFSKQSLNLLMTKCQIPGGHTSISMSIKSRGTSWKQFSPHRK